MNIDSITKTIIADLNIQMAVLTSQARQVADMANGLIGAMAAAIETGQVLPKTAEEWRQKFPQLAQVQGASAEAPVPRRNRRDAVKKEAPVE